MLNNYLILVFKKFFSRTVSGILLDYYPHLILKSDSLENFMVLIHMFKLSSLIRANMLIEFTAVDTPMKAKRFKLNIFLLSVEYNYRIAIIINIMDTTFVSSLVSIYNNSNWSEREMYDLFGIYFVNNPDLRRLLTDYGFEGFPLRKDFPLTGYSEVRYDDESQQILYEPVQLTQEFRLFSLSNP